jgi:hypothetical protein
MKQLAFIIFICTYTLSYSQKGFYLHPSIDYKFDINSNLAYNIITSQGFIIEVTPRNFTAQPLPFLGLQMGYRKKNWFFETGWAQDKFASGLTLTTTEYNTGTQHYETKHYKEYGGTSYNKVPLRFGIRLWGGDTLAATKKWRWQVFVVGSYEVLFKKPVENTKHEQFTTNSQNQKVDFYYYTQDAFTIQRKKTLGFTIKGYTKNGKNINFSVYSLLPQTNANYRHAWSANLMHINNFDGTYNTFHYVSFGGGIYFGISTDMFAKSWLNKKQETDYYKNK